MGVTMRCGRLRVAKQLPDDGKAKGSAGDEGREAVAQIVDADAF